MTALPNPEPPGRNGARKQNAGGPESVNTAETWMMALLIILVPALGGTVYHDRAVAAQHSRLAGELADSRAFVREVVDELVQTRRKLEASETQVKTLVQATTQADEQLRELRGVVTDWQGRNESLASAASRRIAELAARSEENERTLQDERANHEAERSRLEGSLYALGNQLAATDTELRGTRDFAEEAARWNEQLQYGVQSLREHNASLSRSLTTTQSNLASTQSHLESAQSDASSAYNAAQSAANERDRTRHVLARAEGAIANLKHAVTQQHREEVREHQTLVPHQNAPAPRPPQASQAPAAPSHPPPQNAPERHDAPGPRRPR